MMISRNDGKFVKLNNPLMGTETLIELNKGIDITYQIVKLNNPLMGTETLQGLP